VNLLGVKTFLYRGVFGTREDQSFDAYKVSESFYCIEWRDWTLEVDTSALTKTRIAAYTALAAVIWFIPTPYDLLFA